MIPLSKKPTTLILICDGMKTIVYMGNMNSNIILKNVQVQIGKFMTLFCFLSTVTALGQTGNITSKIDSLKYVQGDVFDCGAVTWRIIVHKKEAIQYLIDKIADTTMTQARYLNKDNHLRVGDLAYLTLEKIVSLPLARITGMQFCVIEGGGYQRGTFEYIEANRQRFREQVQAYYDGKKGKLKWKQIDSNHLTACYITHHINGRYE